jgi:multidrug efflux pump subunit AcrA (membrane-fusion protein)
VKRGLSERIGSGFLSLSNRRRLGIAAVLIAGLIFYPLTIQVTADGSVVPRSQHVVYAPLTGQIERMACETGTRVDVGQVLCEFSSHELELNLTRLRGEMLTVQEQLEIAATRRGDGSAKDISSDRRVLDVRLGELQKQLDVLADRQSELVICSPIAGVVSVVMRDNLDTLTAGRPVEIGQALIRVINPTEGYFVELDVPVEDIGYVSTALERSDRRPVECRYRFRSEPEISREGVVTKMGQTASVNAGGRLVVVASVDPRDNEGQFAADSGVLGWIQCDRAAAGFVLSRKIIERLRLWGWL